MHLEIKTYKALLQELDSTSDNCHLLLGNGFNAVLKMETGYENITQKLRDINPHYKDLKIELKKCDFDVERFIKLLEEQIEDIGDIEIRTFLKGYIRPAVKKDFLESLSRIVESKVEDIFDPSVSVWADLQSFLSRFMNFFTLNFDPFLYIILLRLKEPSPSKTTPANKKHKLSPLEKNLCTEMLEIYNDSELFSKMAKYNLTSGVVAVSEIGLKPIGRFAIGLILPQYSKYENYSPEEFNNAFEAAWKKIKGHDDEKARGEKFEQVQLQVKRDFEIQFDMLDSGKPIGRKLHMRDGFGLSLEGLRYLELEQPFDRPPERKQNLFFLHGALHMYQQDDKEGIYKTHKGGDDDGEYQRFYPATIATLRDQAKSDFCVLSPTRKEKKDRIDGNIYLKFCFDKLSELDGNLVIIGVKLDKNDDHIFAQIRANTKIKKIFLSAKPLGNNHFEDETCSCPTCEYYNRAKARFAGKSVILFDRDDIAFKR